MRNHLALALALILGSSGTTGAYQFIEFLNPSNQKVTLKWGSRNMPVPFFINERPPRDFTLDEEIDVASASFLTWDRVPSSTITSRFAGTTRAEPFVFFDFINTLGFSSDPELEGTGILGATSWLVFISTGEIATSDIFFSNFVPWSVAQGGSPGRFDFQSVATHEIGHFFGLGHSGVGIMETADGSRRLLDRSAILYPFAFPRGSTTGRTLAADDIVGISALYPEASFSRETGSLSGQVSKSGRNLLGAHLLAFNPFSGELIGFFTDEEGRYTLRGLKPGPQVVRVNPITDPTSPDDFGFEEVEVDLDFRDAFFQGRAEVRPGLDTPNINLEVRP